MSSPHITNTGSNDQLSIFKLLSQCLRVLIQPAESAQRCVLLSYSLTGEPPVTCTDDPVFCYWSAADWDGRQPGHDYTNETAEKPFRFMMGTRKYRAGKLYIVHRK
jgi:hypothetical protein